MEQKPRQEMSVPELLEARRKVEHRLEMGTGGLSLFGGSDNTFARDELLTILREIDTELAERGYTKGKTD